MSIVEVKVPQLSESVAEATLLEWKKQIGQAVKQDETLIEVETDKVILEVPSPGSGVLVEIIAPNGATVTAEQVIAKIDTAANASAGAASATAATAPATATATIPAPSTATAAPAANTASTTTVMPAAAKLIAENNVSVASGTGKDGRVTKGDVLAALSNPPANVPKVPQAQSAMPEIIAVTNTENLSGRPEERVPMSRLRARIAERLVLSQQTNAILTTFNEVNMQPVMDLRNKFKEQFEKNHGVKLGFMSFFVKAVLAGLKKYPIINASVDGNDIVYHGYFDIGIAVGSPRGLVVPVLRNVDQMSFADIEKQIADFGARAQAGKLTIEELSGGTFSISNGGTFGSMMSTPIINPPQSAILGVHATKERAVVENGQIVARPMNYFAVSYDHRIIDGREAVLFLVTVKEALEDPARILLDL